MRYLLFIFLFSFLMSCKKETPVVIKKSLLHGTVLQKGSNAPVPNAVVWLRDTLGVDIKHTFTNSNGQYSIELNDSSIPKYELYFHAADYFDLTSKVRVSAGENIYDQILTPKGWIKLVIHPHTQYGYTYFGESGIWGKTWYSINNTETGLFEVEGYRISKYSGYAVRNGSQEGDYLGGSIFVPACDTVALNIELP